MYHATDRESIIDAQAAHERAVSELRNAKAAKKSAELRVLELRHLPPRYFDREVAESRLDRAIERVDEAERAEQLTRDILCEIIADAGAR